MSNGLVAPTPYLTGTHYISDNLYTLGSLACCVCGHQFPLHTSPQRHAVCPNCGAAHLPGSHLDIASHGGTRAGDTHAAARFFTSAEIAEAVVHVDRVCGRDGTSSDAAAGGRCQQREGQAGEEAQEGGATAVVRVGQTAVDNRVLEEAFCENCATHRMCKTFARQTRSADEGQTIFFQCTVCDAEWQQSS